MGGVSTSQLATVIARVIPFPVEFGVSSSTPDTERQAISLGFDFARKVRCIPGIEVVGAGQDQEPIFSSLTVYRRDLDQASQHLELRSSFPSRGQQGLHTLKIEGGGVDFFTMEIREAVLESVDFNRTELVGKRRLEALRDFRELDPAEGRPSPILRIMENLTLNNLPLGDAACAIRWCGTSRSHDPLKPARMVSLEIERSADEVQVKFGQFPYSPTMRWYIARSSDSSAALAEPELIRDVTAAFLNEQGGSSNLYFATLGQFSPVTEREATSHSNAWQDV